MLDEAGLENAAIVASSDLDEWILESLKQQGACINVWGVGTRLVTSFSEPALGGVYKLTALDEGGKRMVPKIKRSDNPEKITNPGLKKVVRMYDGEGKMRGDVLCLDEEQIPGKTPLMAYHPVLPHVHKTYPGNFEKRELMRPIFRQGIQVGESPSLARIREHALQNLEQLDAAYKRFKNPHAYHVSLSQQLHEVKGHLLHRAEDQE